MMDKEFVKNTKFKKLKTEVNNLGKCQILLRQFRQIYSSQIAKFKEENEDVDKNVPVASGLVTTIVLNTKIGEVENKTLVFQSRKQFVTPEYKTSRKNISIILIKMNLQNKMLHENMKKRNQLNHLIFLISEKTLI